MMTPKLGMLYVTKHSNDFGIIVKITSFVANNKSYTNLTILWKDAGSDGYSSVITNILSQHYNECAIDIF